MAFVEPLELQSWFVPILSGASSYFAPIAVFAILCMAAYFRMTGLTMGFMVFVFLMMFSGFIPASFLVFVSIIGGLLVGWYVSRIVRY